MNKRPIFDRRTVFFSIMVLLLFFVLAFLIIRNPCGQFLAKHPEWFLQRERMLANKLRGVGLQRQAARAFESYLKESDIAPGEMGKIAYTIGQMYMESKDYEEALPWLYRAELSGPDTELKSKLGPLIITCLERLGHYQAAEYALKSRTALDPNQFGSETEGNKVVARIGQDIITLSQINEAFDGLPPWIKKEFAEPGKKKEFAKQYIVEEILYRKGLKLGYTKDPANIKKVEQFKRQLIIGQIQKEEIEEKLTVDEADVKNYFIAHQEDYKDPNQKLLPNFEEIKNRITEDYKHVKIQKMYQDLIQQTLSGTDVKLYLENVN
ncbi:MAG: hypothetical protein ACMUIU_04375 [bacterium]